uniref:Capsid protein n=1 Tax=Rosellinia necatrix partitivirus 16 TaxID=2699384 RepID=A0A6F8QHE4_9VIRU|nr:capsid protein [Rosellinia necatrix partitivirus 16]
MPSATAARATSLGSKSKETHYKEFEVPDSKVDFFSQYKAKSGIDDAKSNEIMFAVIPDLRPLFAMCLQFTSKYYPQVDLKGHAKVSPATLCYYFMFMTYAYILFSDYSVSGNPSRFAQEIFQDDQYKQFFYSILAFPVPEFLETWMKFLSYATLNENDSVYAILSAAGYSHRHDFGRIIPTSFMSNLHDLLPKVTSRDTVDAIWKKFFTSTLYEARLRKSSTSADKVTVANMLGVYTDGTDPRFVNHRLFQLVESVYNPFLSRSYARRDSFARINLQTPVFDSVHVNPFVMMFSLSPENLTEITVVLESVRDAFKGIIPCSSDLAKVFTNQSGLGIWQSGNSGFSLPTFHADPNVTLPDTDLKQISAKDYAARLHFKQQHNHTLAADVPFPRHGTDNANSNLDLVLVSTTRAPTDQPDFNPPNTSFAKFDPRHDQYAPVVVLFPNDKQIESTYMTTLCGLIIESEEIDASGLPLVDPRQHIGDTNNEVLSSAIRLDKIRVATDFITSTTQRYWHMVTPRRMTESPAFKSSTLLVDMSRMIVPQLGSRIISANIPTAATLPGLHLWRNVHAPFYALRFYGSDIKVYHNQAEQVDSAVISDPSNVADGQILVWSPYRFVSMVNRKRTLSNTEYDTIYMITNLRTIFGTKAPAVGTKHFQEALPQ